MRARIKVKVTNTGVSPANALGVQPTTARLFWNAQGANTAVSPDYIEAGGAQAVPTLPSLSHTTLVWEEVILTEDRGLFGVTARLEGTNDEVNHNNDEATRYFRLPPVRRSNRGD